MAFDGIVTKAITHELQNIINYKIDKIFEPDKNTIILGLYNNKEHLALNICIEAQNCRLNLTTHAKPNPTVAPNFCMLLRKHLIGGKILNIKTYDLERLVSIDIEAYDEKYNYVTKKLIIELMGKHSNIILINSNNIIIDSLRHTSSETALRDIFPNYEYIFPVSNKESFINIDNFEEFYNLISPNLQNLSIDKNISNTFNGISKSFIKYSLDILNITEINKTTLEKLYNYIKDIIKRINSNNLYFKNFEKDYVLIIDNNPNLYGLNFFIDDYYYIKEKNERFISSRNAILKLILDNLKKYKIRLNNINSKLEECSKRDEYKLYGELITANLYKIKSNHLDFIELENYYDNNNLIKIPLDKKYSASENAKRYFKKYTKLKNALDIVSIQKQETLQELEYIESIVYELENSSSLEEIEQIFEEVYENVIFKDKLQKQNVKKKKFNNKKNNKKSLSFNPLKYEIENYIVYVGKNNKENDYLTTKFANKFDIWFHTKDIHGSHVILKLNSQDEKVPDNILLECAKLAAQHSKAKNSTNVPVDYCKVQFVKKPHNSKPGMVIYSNNKTLYVR